MSERPRLKMPPATHIRVRGNLSDPTTVEVSAVLPDGSVHLLPVMSVRFEAHAGVEPGTLMVVLSQRHVDVDVTADTKDVAAVEAS